MHRVELLPLSPEECGAECLSYRPFAVCISRRRIRPHALSALWAYCGGWRSVPLDPLLSSLIDGNQTVTVCAAVIRPTGSQLADMCRLVELVCISLMSLALPCESLTQCAHIHTHSLINHYNFDSLFTVYSKCLQIQILKEFSRNVS